MTKNVSAKLTIIIAVFALAVGGLTACGQTASAGQNQDGSSGQGEKRTIYVQTASDMPPNGFADDNGDPAGYEADLFREVEKLLPQYDFDFTAAPRESLDNNLLSGKIDVEVFMQSPLGDESGKFDYGQVQYNTLVEQIYVLEENAHKYKSLEDFQGKTLYMFPNQPSTQNVLDFNEEHKDNPIIVEYMTDPTTSINDLKNGKADGFARNQTSIVTYNKNFGVPLAISDVGALIVKPVQYKYRKGEDPKLIEDIDGALQTLKDNGTITELHKKWYFGTDWDFDGNISEFLAEHPLEE